jgi:hypothetical protein
VTDNRPYVHLPDELYALHPNLHEVAGEIDRLARLDELKHLPDDVLKRIAELEGE